MDRAKGAALVGFVAFLAGLHVAFGMFALYHFDNHMGMTVMWFLAVLYTYLALIVIDHIRRDAPL